MPKGKLIVIDGTDGSGKATQARILHEKLQKNGEKVRLIDFPQYEKNFFGKMVGECLTGKYGNWVEVHPKIASVIYAADRWEASKKIKNWLKKGYYVIADRYASSNQIHQGGKIKNKTEREEFLNWLDNLEFKVFQIPRPDVIIYLDMPISVSSSLLEKRGESFKKAYLKKEKTDLHEKNTEYLEKVRKSAMELVREKNNWKKISCFEKGKLLSIEKISSLIWDCLFQNKG